MSLPTATLTPTPFKLAVPQADIDAFRALLKLSRLPPPTYEGANEKFGVTNKWMAETKEYWEKCFDWRKHEAEINKLPQFVVPVANSDGREYNIHYIGVISPHTDAVPLLLLHGWPGSFVEFLDLIPILRDAAPGFHIIVPSLPGYAYSAQAPLDKEFGQLDVAYLLNELMVGLGLGRSCNGGYVVQGGDLGSFLARVLQNRYPDCRGSHVNMWIPHERHSTTGLDETDIVALGRGAQFKTTGMAYSMVHATRPSTIGHVIAASPLSLLAWLGEKLLEWTDKSPPVEKILQIVTLWWLTDTFPRAIYPYREIIATRVEFMSDPITKPIGYSWFPMEMSPTPIQWMREEASDLLVFAKRNKDGGHFAAMEVPRLLAADIIAFVDVLKGV